MAEEPLGNKLSTKQLEALEVLLDEVEALPPGQQYEAITHSGCEETVRNEALSRIMGNAQTIDDTGAVAKTRPQPGRDLAGRMIGPFKVTRLIGSGGMGQVYEAVQEHPRRTVAIKLLRKSIDSEKTRARFHYEVQTLGRLQHPGIARVYDAGVFEEDGIEQPYFAMEYVPNAKELDRYVRDKDLSIDARLKLFADVCDAVAHGHERGIIHRDLKPGNVLVDGRGQIKIIDFGVAKATDSDVTMTAARTAVGQIIGTLQYMSPEQCAADPNDIDIRSDVYSLGVVLYELLSGKMPYDLEGTAIHAAIQVVQEREPTSLSSATTMISPDIEVITHKALEKERVRRYRSAGDLGDDVRRYLADEPITARPPSFSEHVRRYARKNKVTAVATAAVAAVVVVSAVAIVVFALEASRQRGIAEGRAERLRASTLELVTTLRPQIKNLAGSLEARSTLFDLSMAQLDGLLEENEFDLDAKALKAVIHTSRGDMFGGPRTANLGLKNEAMAEYAAAEALWRSLLNEHENQTAASLELARVLRRQGDLMREHDADAALAKYREAHTVAVAVSDAQETNRTALRSVALSLQSIAAGEQALGRFDDAAATLDENRLVALQLLLERPADSVLKQDLAFVYRRQGHLAKVADDLPKAVGGHREALALLEANRKAFPDDVVKVRHAAWQHAMLAEVLVLHGTTDEGVRMMRRGVELSLEGCRRSPDDANQRAAVLGIVTGGVELFREHDHPAESRALRASAIVVLEGVVERNPDSDALERLLADIMTLNLAQGG